MDPLLGCVGDKSRVCYTPRGNPGSWGPAGHGCSAQEAGLTSRAGLRLSEVALPGMRKRTTTLQLCSTSKVGFL